MTDSLKIPIGTQAPDVVTAVVEIPQGCVNKYEYDKKLHIFRLDRNLHSPIHYPGDYGFIPRTLAEDRDTLDILVLGIRRPSRAASILFVRSASSRCSITGCETKRF
jgi:inorganic pyrophosphatase